jgi:hypothetical protein
VSDESVKAQMVRAMAPLIEQAQRERKFLHCHYQDMWFSPLALKQAQSRGEFCWGPANWTLRDPSERTKRLEQEVVDATVRLEEWKKTVAGTI